MNKQEDNEQNKQNQMQLITLEPIEDIFQKKKQIKKKKKKKKKKKNTYESIIASKNYIKKIQDKIDQCEYIPDLLKRKYKKIEVSPYCLIVENLITDVNSLEYIEFFSTLINSLDSKYQTLKIEPIKSFYIGETQQFAVIECADIEAVHKLLKLSPIIYCDQKLYLMRPKGFFVKHFQNKQYEIDENGNLKNMDQSQNFTLYISNLPQYMKEQQIKTLLQSFGVLKSFQMKIDSRRGENYTRGYCLAEYHQSKDAINALDKLQDLQIGNNKLKVQKLQLDKDNQKKQSIAPTKELQTSFLLMFPKIRDPLVQAMIYIPQYCYIPSKRVQILNMFSITDLFKDDFVFELQQDVEQECQRYGKINKIFIKQPNKNTGECDSLVGKVIVEYDGVTEAKRAQYKLNGRQYNNRTIIVSFFSQEIELNQFINQQYKVSIC